MLYSCKAGSVDYVTKVGFLNSGLLGPDPNNILLLVRM